MRLRRRVQRALKLMGILLGCVPWSSRAADVLVADRLANAVFRYSESGEYLGVVTREIIVPDVPPTYLYQPTGIAMSPDYSQLYVSSSQLNQVVKYDYDRVTGTATNPTIFADASNDLSFPNDIKFSPDGSKIYVANLNGGVSQFHVDGSSAGDKMFLPTVTGEGTAQTASMNFNSAGQLLAGAFVDPSGAGGGIAITDPEVTGFTGFLVTPRTVIRGATGLMIHDDYIYVSGLYAAGIRRFSLSDGQMDTSWAITSVQFPQDLEIAPDGEGFLLGILGQFPGGGRIARYAFDGTLLGTFALPSEEGFTEATAFVVVPTSLPGDFNNDGVVDAADYVVWRKTSPTDLSGYNEWATNFGKSDSSGSGSLGSDPVPEPAGVVLLLIAIVFGSMVRNRK